MRTKVFLPVAGEEIAIEPAASISGCYKFGFMVSARLYGFQYVKKCYKDR